MLSLYCRKPPFLYYTYRDCLGMEQRMSKQIKSPSSAICYDAKHGGSIKFWRLCLSVHELDYVKHPAL
jgi:hypothetical protein